MITRDDAISQFVVQIVTLASCLVDFRLTEMLGEFLIESRLAVLDFERVENVGVAIDLHVCDRADNGNQLDNVHGDIWLRASRR